MHFSTLTSTQRGTVCDDMFSIVTGTIVCTEMGFKCAREYYKVMPISDIQSTYDIILDNVECSENATVFGDCSYDIGHNCGHAEDVFLTCSKSPHLITLFRVSSALYIVHVIHDNECHAYCITCTIYRALDTHTLLINI